MIIIIMIIAMRVIRGLVHDLIAHAAHHGERVVNVAGLLLLLLSLVETSPLTIFYPPLKYLGGCFWLFYRLRRETPISQSWLKG